MESLPAFRNSSTKRNEFFAKLKPCCVEISKLALRDGDVSSRSAELTRLTGRLFDILNTQASFDASTFDAKIAEYVFFPLSFIFRRKELYPARLIENATKCLRLLIQHGWRADIGKELAQQLLILLTFIVGGVPGQDQRPDVLPDETLVEGYKALAALIRAAGAAPLQTSPLVETTVIPTLGHSVSVILEGVTNGRTPEIQLEALEAVQALYATVRVQEALASFMPGTVSSLARILSPPVSLKSQRRLLIRGLQVVKDVLISVLGDVQTRAIQKQLQAGKSGESDSGKTWSPSWLKATASQVKMALSTMLKLRNHESDDVRSAVERLCISLLDECHSSLSECASILLESAIIASKEEGDEDQQSAGLHGLDPHLNFQGLTRDTTLQDLATIYPELADAIKSIVYNWVTSLPRVMQSSDETVKHQAIRNVSKSKNLVKDLHIESATLDDTLATALRDSITTLILNSRPAKLVDEGEVEEGLSQDAALVKSDAELQRYRPVLLAQDGQKRTREEMVALVSNIGSPTQQAKLAGEMLSYLREADGVDQLSAYWLSFELLKAAFSKSGDLDAYLDFSSLTNASEDLDVIFDELYSFSVSTLASHSDSVDADWRLEAIALEVTSFAASRTREDFRPELIDVLYPIATFLGSPNPQLRTHAIVALNGIAAFCGYGSVSELIIGNVDYMVNSVSLRLNTLDISPASTRVLTMMIHLTGPRLIPFLDDVVTTIFAALESYHGHPSFVEGLFSVLSEVVEQGVKSDRLLLEGGQSRALSHQKKRPEPTTTEDIIAVLDKRAERSRRNREEDDIKQVRSHPKRPWNSEAEELLKKHAEEDDPPDEAPPSSNDDVDKKDEAKTATYTLLARITTLTQHYLTSPAPALRKSLLDLLSKAAPALAPDEDAFLPLVNAIWPVLVSRLYDGEPYVAIAAGRTLGALCASAGDFLASRIKTEWWDGLGKWCIKAKAEAAKAGGRAGGGSGSASRLLPSGPRGDRGLGKRPLGGDDDGILIPIRSGGGETTSQLVQTPDSHSRGLGRFAQAVQVWEAAVAMLTNIVSCVRLDDDVFDQILNLLADTLVHNEEARKALEIINADAVWLALYKRKQTEPMTAPVMDGVRFVQLA